VPVQHSFRGPQTIQTILSLPLRARRLAHRRFRFGLLERLRHASLQILCQCLFIFRRDRFKGWRFRQIETHDAQSSALFPGALADRFFNCLKIMQM